MISFSKLPGWICLLSLCLGSVPVSNAQTAIPPVPANFPNVLNVKGLPQDAKDRSVFAFSDMGAWFAYGLPDHPAFLGSFTGPFLMTQDNGVWSAPCLARMELYNPYTGETYNFMNAKNVFSLSLPGRLRQGFELENPGVSLGIDLIFVSNRTALIMIDIRSLDKNLRPNIGIRWMGRSMLERLTFGQAEGSVQIKMGDKGQIGYISWSEINPAILYASVEQYHVAFNGAGINADEGWQIAMTQSICFDAKEWAAEKPRVQAILADPQSHLQLNEKRWTRMLGEVIRQDMPADQHRLAVKCLETLISNWRSPAGFLRHDGLFPSYNYEWFHGFWAWDSWKHAVALAKFHPELARNQILAMVDFQHERGMIADCVYRDTAIEQHNWRNSKPPLAAWAAWQLFEQTADTSFLRQLFPRLVHYHQWWYTDRDHDQNGLCEYGSTDGSLEAAKWESGMDNALRFDNAEIVQNNEHAWSMNQESVDLNAYLYAEKKYLALIAGQIGEEAKSKSYLEEADQLKSRIQAVFYDAASGWFYDVNLETKAPILIQGPEGWIPLWAEAASRKQAASARKIMLDSSKFATYIPFPSLAADQPPFSPEKGYWRGPVWLDQAYFAIAGLRKYGYEKDAERFTLQLIERLAGLKKGDAPIRENYHPLTGEGLGANHFSWSAAHLLMLMWSEDF